MKKIAIYLTIFVGIFAFVFKSLLLNLSTNLQDWLDYPFVVWLIAQNAHKIIAGDIANIFNTNILYPQQNTIFLAETLISQSVLAVPFALLTKNVILIFNLVFFATFFLNGLSAFLLWKKIFNKNSLAILGSFITLFSPFFITQLGHFQLMSYWPLLFGLFFLLEDNSQKKWRKFVLVGVFLVVQFLASVYLAFYFIAAIVTYLFASFLTGQSFKKNLAAALIIFSTFVVLGGIFIKGYLDTPKQFSIKRDLGEYVNYAASTTDYLFPRQTGLLYRNIFVEKLLSYNKHNFGEVASFPGLVLLATALLGMFKYERNKKHLSIHFKQTVNNYFFLFLTIIGLLFSFGPRVMVNGINSGIPLPYALLIKFVPLFGAIRSTSRWAFLFYLGLSYFSLGFINNIKKTWLLAAVTLLFVLDVTPAPMPSAYDTFILPKDETLKTVCAAKKTALLEIPVTHFDAGKSITDGLSYLTKRLLATTENKCYLVNSYGSYDFPHIQKLKDDINFSLQSRNSRLFLAALNSSGADIFSINREVLIPQTRTGSEFVILQLIKEKKITPLGNDVFKIN